MPGNANIYFSTREIHIGIGKSPVQLSLFDPDKVELAVAHELIHAAIPDRRLSFIPRTFFEHLMASCIRDKGVSDRIDTESENSDFYRRLKRYKDYEEVIDEAAEKYARDRKFMEQVSELLPSEVID